MSLKHCSTINWILTRPHGWIPGGRASKSEFSMPNYLPHRYSTTYLQQPSSLTPLLVILQNSKTLLLCLTRMSQGTSKPTSNSPYLKIRIRNITNSRRWLKNNYWLKKRECMKGTAKLTTFTKRKTRNGKEKSHKSIKLWICASIRRIGEFLNQSL